VAKSGKPDEFEMISRYFAPLAAADPGALGLADDAALLVPEPGRRLVLTTDSLVAGVHFPVEEDPALVAAKLIGVNLSDLAAMGATPWVYTLSVSWPKDFEAGWVELFTDGLGREQETYGIHLVGGDTVATSGPLTLCLTALGSAEEGRELRRSGAQAGDDVYVSGTIGDAALGFLGQGDFQLPRTVGDGNLTVHEFEFVMTERADEQAHKIAMRDRHFFFE